MPKGGRTVLSPGENNLVTAASIQMRAEILSYGGGNLRGILNNRYLDKPFVFDDLLLMIEKMESIFDTKGFPESFTTPRVFGTFNHNRNFHKTDGDTDMTDIINSIVSPEHCGQTCTFEISVRFRQNSSWQGQILWAEKNLKQNFRSVLEMLKLMDEALKESESKPEPIKWES